MIESCILDLCTQVSARTSPQGSGGSFMGARGDGLLGKNQQGLHISASITDRGRREVP